MNSSPIGIFDSGLGGLTVVRELRKVLPNEDLVYLGDTARVPYGTRSAKVIKGFSEQNTAFLLKKKVKCIVIACNTSSATSASFLKRKFAGVPIFEVISSAARESVQGGKRIGVIGTRATIGSNAYVKEIQKKSKTAEVYSEACPLLVPFIEEGEINGRGLEFILKKYLTPLKKAKIDTLILGCTHYPIIKDLIQKEMGESIRLVNPEKTVVGEVKNFLDMKSMLNAKKALGKREFYVTDLTDRFAKVAEMFLSDKIRGDLKEVELE